MAEIRIVSMCHTLHAQERVGRRKKIDTVQSACGCTGLLHDLEDQKQISLE